MLNPLLVAVVVMTFSKFNVADCDFSFDYSFHVVAQCHLLY